MKFAEGYTKLCKAKNFHTISDENGNLLLFPFANGSVRRKIFITSTKTVTRDSSSENLVMSEYSPIDLFSGIGRTGNSIFLVTL